MKNRFAAFLIMLVMVACSVYIGGYRSLSQLREEISYIEDIEIYNQRANEFNKNIDDVFLTRTLANIVGIERLELK